MRSLRWILVRVVSVALLAAGCSAGRASESFSKQHADALRDSVAMTLIDYTNRFNSHDLDSVVRFYADDPRWVWAAEGRVARQSKILVKQRLENLAGFSRWRVRYAKMSIVPLAPGLAFVTTEYAMRFGDSLVTRLRFVGALTTFWVNTPAGWKISGGHSSTLPDAIATASRCFRSDNSVLLGPPTASGPQGEGPGWIRLAGGLQFDSGPAVLADRDGKRLEGAWTWEDSTKLELLARNDYLRVNLGFHLMDGGHILGIGNAHSAAGPELRRAWTVQADEASCDSMPNRAK